MWGTWGRGIAAFAMCTFVLFSSLACAAPDSSTAQSSVGKGERYVLGVSFPTTALPFRKSMADLALEQYGPNADNARVEIVLKDAEGSEQKQNQDIIDLVNSGVDGIVLVPGTVEGSISAVRYANDKEVPIITVDNRMEASTTAQVVSFVGADHYRMGFQAAGLLVSSLEKKKSGRNSWNVVELVGTRESSGAIDRGEGIAETLSSDSRIKIVGTYNASFTDVDAQSVMEDVLTLHDDIDGVICQNDMMALGCYRALELAGKRGDVVVVGIDGQSSVLHVMESGGIDGTVAQSPEMINRGIEKLCDYLDGAALDPSYIEETEIVSADKASAYLSSHINW